MNAYKSSVIHNRSKTSNLCGLLHPLIDLKMFFFLKSNCEAVTLILCKTLSFITTPLGPCEKALACRPAPPSSQPSHSQGKESDVS